MVATKRLLLVLSSCAALHMTSAHATRCAEPNMSADLPSIIVGGGRIGLLLADLGVPGDTVMRRGDPFPELPSEGPIYVSTRNDALAGIIESTPPHRRAELCLTRARCRKLLFGSLAPFLH